MERGITNLVIIWKINIKYLFKINIKSMYLYLFDYKMDIKKLSSKKIQFNYQKRDELREKMGV
jgi:hypothetical protein